MRETAGQIPPRLSAEPSEDSEQPLGELGNPDPISTSCDFKRSLWLAGRFASLRFALLHFASLPPAAAAPPPSPRRLCPHHSGARGALPRRRPRPRSQSAPDGRQDRDPGPGPDPDPGPRRCGAPGSASPAARSEELQLRGGTGRGSEGQSPPG